MLLFLCVVCILKWLNVQPKIVTMPVCALTTEQVLELATTEKHNKYACVVMKTTLTSSILFFIAHIVLFATER